MHGKVAIWKERTAEEKTSTDWRGLKQNKVQTE